MAQNGRGVAEEEAASMASLIQKRMAVTRAKSSGVIRIVIAALFILLWWFALFLGSSMLSAAGGLLFGLVVGVDGVRVYVRALRSEAAFNAEYGKDAGLQEPIR